MKLSDILNKESILDTNFKIDGEKEINKIAFHTDDVVEGSIFVAIKGYITDGHKLTMISPRSFTATPAASRLRLAVLALRPVATNTASAGILTDIPLLRSR